MGLQYILSAGQWKQIDERGCEIQIALPIPPIAIRDPLAWARSVLEPEAADLAVAAEPRDLWVQAIRANRPGPGNEPTLTQHLGTITEPRPGVLVQCVRTIVVTLRPRRHRLESSKITWPLHAILDGQQWPRPLTH